MSNAKDIDTLIEEKINEFFDENFDFLREREGHVISVNLKEQAREQVLYYWRKNKDIVQKITRTEVKLSLPEQKTPNLGLPYTIEGVVDIVREGDETWLYDLKTHPVERIKGQPECYREQLSIYGYIWAELQENELHNMAIISTPLPQDLLNAIRSKNPKAIDSYMKKWEPIIPFGYSEEDVADMIENFGTTVEKIENSEFQPPSVDVLKDKPTGMKAMFGNFICRNCDVRFSCDSFKGFLTSTRSVKRNNMIEYMLPSESEGDEFVNDNLEDETDL